MASPNIIVILVDDMGARDLGCTGSTFYETPNIDRLAAEGVNFTCGYAASALCSPARAAVMTGRAPARVGITNYIPGNAMGRLLGAPYHFHLPRKNRTIATALSEAGYHTWHVGKWHLGGADEKSLPTDHGFEVNIGGDHHGGLYHIPGVYYAPYVGRDGSVLPGLEESREGEYLTDRLTDEAIGLIRSRADERPFFLHLSHYAVHMPIVSPPPLVDRFEAKARRLGLDRVDPLLPGEPHPALHYSGQVIQRRTVQSDPGYAAMIANLDWNVGRLMETLAEEGVDEDTMVVFLSDNGGLSVGVEGSITCNLPYAEGKGWSEEGGLRVPMLWRWPGGIPGGRVVSDPMWQCDLYPTFLHAAGMRPEIESHRDGVSILDTLTSGAPLPKRQFCWHYPHYSNQGSLPGGAIRDGDWKLIQCYETGRTTLYNLKEDVSESFDQSTWRPDVTERLQEELEVWRGEVGAIMPRNNPFYEDILAGNLPTPNGQGRFPGENE